MRLLVAMVLLISASTSSGEEAKKVSEFVVEQCSGVLTTAVDLKGHKIKGAFVTLYRKNGAFTLESATVKLLLDNSKGGYHEKDPLLSEPTFRFVVQTSEKSGLRFGVYANGRIAYRGVREFSNGIFEEDDSEHKPGSFANRRLAEKLVHEWRTRSSSESPLKNQ
jgi:hypothetical protein